MSLSSALGKFLFWYIDTRLNFFALTSLGNARDVVQHLVDPETFQDVGEIWNLNDEGEFNGVWGDIGVPNLWFMMGKNQGLMKKKDVSADLDSTREPCLVSLLFKTNVTP